MSDLHCSKRGGSAAVAAIGALLLSSLVPERAHAFDTLAAMAARLPVEAIDEQVGGPELYFMSPRLVADWPVRDIPGVGFVDMGPALLDRQIGIDTVGIPFPELDGILNYGSPPETLILLSGDAISVTDVGDALLRRPNMEETERAGITVFAEGEDYETDFAGRDPDYPFGGGWRAHRVAVWSGGAAVAFGWDVLDPALPALAAGDGFVPAPGAAVLAAMVEAADAAAPGSADAVAASGLGGQMLAATAEALAAIPEDRRIPPFAYVLLIASAGAEMEATQAVFAFNSRERAEVGAAALAANLEEAEFREPNCKIVTEVVERAGAFLAVISVVFQPGTEGHPGTGELSRWQTDLFAGRFELFPVGG